MGTGVVARSRRVAIAQGAASFGPAMLGRRSSELCRWSTRGYQRAAVH
jgi:hypothetical protein